MTTTFVHRRRTPNMTEPRFRVDISSKSETIWEQGFANNVPR